MGPNPPQLDVPGQGEEPREAQLKIRGSSTPASSPSGPAPTAASPVRAARQDWDARRPQLPSPPWTSSASMEKDSGFLVDGKDLRWRSTVL
jgi:hypothetical protein